MGEKTQGGITMPNKDSFTFSDKLRKSKSVPLSKRLPSIVGGQNKQKRTLVQRAQRDLPFILVAALALLLLPFLSRTGSDDIASGGMGDWGIVNPDDQNRWIEGERDIMPEGSMEDPMKWIIGARSDVKESGATMGTDANKSAYGSGSSDDGYGDSSSGYSSRYGSRKTTTSSSKTPDYNTRKSYDEQYTTRTTKKPATAQYAKTTRSSVRKSFERKPTNINKDLRISQMPGHRGGSGISHALPLGQGPSRTPGTAFREGIRPVALQRMESRGGVGRGTEGLRAEADRSIREMNAGGPAKANLLAAQMRDIDGKPVGEGPGFGGPSGGGAASRLPGGGGPNNQNGYHVDKPWWWDMMQARSQKMWDLLYYEPRRIWYTNMYNYLSQLMNCLFTGNKDGDVSTMFGKGAADSDWACVKDGKEVMPRYNKQKTRNTKDKDGNKTEETVDSSWVNECINIAKGDIIEKEKEAKSFLDVRMECVGLDVVIDWMKSLTGKEYHQGCDGVTVDGISYYSVDVLKKGLFSSEYKNSDRLNSRVVIALLAKYNGTGKDYDSNEYVVWAENSQDLSEEGLKIAKDFRDNKYPNCKLTKVVSFVPRNIRSGSFIKSFTEKSEDPEYKNKNKEVHPTLVDMPSRAAFSREICEGKPTAKKYALTINELRGHLYPKKGSFNSCAVPSPEQFVEEMILDGTECFKYPSVAINIDSRPEAEAFIPNPAGKYVFAIAVEQLTSMKDPEIRDIKEYGLISLEKASRDVRHTGYEYDETKKAYHFYYKTNLAVEGINKEYSIAIDPMQSSDTVRGDGRIFWIVTSQSKLNKDIITGSSKFKGISLNEITPADFVDDYANSGICHYQWCNVVDSCSLERRNRDKVCKHSNGKYYSYQTYTLAGERILFPLQEESNYTPTNNEPPCTELCRGVDDIHCPNNKTVKIKDVEDNNLLPAGLIDEIPLCVPYCEYKGKVYDATLIGRKYYIINAEERHVDYPEIPKCSPLAWAWENGDFRIYDFVDEYDDTQLSLIPNQLMDATLATHNTYTTRLNYLEQSSLFITIRGQSFNTKYNPSGDPTLFKLFPRLVLPGEVDVNLVNACNFCGPSLYDNADVRAGQRTINDITGKIRNCFNQVKQLEAILGSDDPDIQQLKSVYYYGYASKRGSHDPYMIPGADSVGCTTSVHGNGALKKPKRQNTMWDSGFEELGDCNKALSEDRNLYIMDKVIGNLSEFEIDVKKEISYPGYRGFTNTLGPVSKAGKKPSYRLIKQPSASGTEFAFISYPCGSLGAAAEYTASKDVQAPDRLVLITPINEGDDYCENRMTCDMADKKMTAIERSIKQKLSRKGISTLESSSRSNGATAFATVTQSDADFISAEEIAEVMRTESVDQNANPQA